MSIICWNCWGLGNLNAVSSLRDLVRTYQSDVLFLCETLVPASRIDDIRVRLGFDSSFAVNSMGRSGGLAVFWKDPFDCHLISYSQNFINLWVCQPDIPDWRLTCFYGYPDSGRWRDSWNLLRPLSMDNSLPWCIIGDFNDLLSNDDKRGRRDHPHWKIQGFRDAAMDSHLIDIPIEVYQFTWAKGRGTDDFKEERLDRAMATQVWKDNFPNHRLCNSVIDRSNHTPIVLHLFAQGHRRRRRGFKFENSWLEEEQLEAIVEKGWALGKVMDVLNRLKACTEEMNVWGRSLRMRYRADIDGCRKKLESLREDVSQAACMRYKEVQAKLT